MRFLGLSSFVCSKPTGWDGDLYYERKLLAYVSSEPTGWDGDRLSCIAFFVQFVCSEPTVWDGDQKSGF